MHGAAGRVYWTSPLAAARYQTLENTCSISGFKKHKTHYKVKSPLVCYPKQHPQRDLDPLDKWLGWFPKKN